MEVKKISKALLEIVRKKNGQTLQRKDLVNQLIFQTQEKRNRKSSQSKKSKINKERSRMKQDHADQEILQMIASLIGLGILKEQGREIMIQSPGYVQGEFHGIRAGGGFVKIDYSNQEVFVSAGSGPGLMHRDYILVELSHFYRDKWEGTAVQVLRSHRRRLFAQFLGLQEYVLEYGKKIKLPLLRIFDTPGMEFAVLEVNKEEAFKPGTIMLISPSRDSHGFPRTDASGLALMRAKGELSPEDPDLDLQRIVAKHGLADRWPDLNYLRQLEQWEKEYPDPAQLIAFLDRNSVWSNLDRKDRSHLFTVTIDGDTAKDFDDAISYQMIQGKHHLYVHIADLAVWLQGDSDMDREAMMRGNSTYLQNHVIHMLPPFLSERYCSLRAGEKKAAFTCEMILDKTLHIESYEFYPSLIQVDYRLTYKKAEEMLQGVLGHFENPDKDKIISDFLIGIKKITDVLRKRSFTAGRLDLNLPDILIAVDPLAKSDESRYHVHVDAELQSNHLIEELMLAANQSAADFLKKRGIGALFRVHEKPDPEKLFALQEELSFFGLEWEWDEQDLIGSFARLGRLIRGHRLHNFFSYLLLRSLKQAQYLNDAGIGHFGLGFSDYLHFTSPIRRYPDLVVHRQIRNALAGRRPFYDDHDLTQLGTQVSASERLSMEAERDMKKLTLCRAYQESVGKSFEVMLTGFFRLGFFVTLADIPVEGRLLLENIYGDYFEFFEEEKAAIGQRTGLRFEIGQVWLVELKQSNWEEMSLDFSYQISSKAGRVKK